MTKKQEVRLMFFSGFYHSIHLWNREREEEYILEEHEGKTYDDFDWTYDWEEYSKMYVSAISSKMGIKLEFQELISPREYNFTTDKIICWISSKDVKKLSSALNSPTLERLVKERFTSRDGFISFYSRYVEDWKEKKLKDWDAVELGTLLDAWLIDNGFEIDGDDSLDYVGYVYCSENGSYVDYTKLWDEKAEQEEKELHEKELNKLEQWNKSVKSW